MLLNGTGNETMRHGMMWDILLPLLGSKELNMSSESYNVFFPCSGSAKILQPLNIPIYFKQWMRSLKNREGYVQKKFKVQLLCPVHFKNLLRKQFFSCLGIFFCLKSGHFCLCSMSFVVTGMQAIKPVYSFLHKR